MNVSIWWTIPALTGLIGLVIFLGGVGRLFKLRMASGLSRFLFGGVFLAGAMVTALFGMNLQTYARLTHERIAAQVTLEELGPRLYRASVVVPNDKGVMGEPRYYELTGDAMRMDARFLKWRPWANVAGYDAIYRLDRIQGRFDEVSMENATPPIAYDLAPEARSAGLDIYQLSRQNEMMKKFNAVDAIYGAGSYAPMADGAVYDMMATQSGLVPRPQNEAARAAALKWGAPSGKPGNAVSITSGQDAN
ncbi:MAG: hypothetical protein CME88_09515 [Hirschia sp.]|nr:hypothetical protein [Hirschia sp.]MBF18603.1 hypothetical protein [Hirschia sp.]